MFKALRPQEFWLWTALFSGLAALYFYLMKPDVAGFLYDDGMYLMAAKALATGQGYRLIDVVGSPWFYKYPPLFPSVLALGWLINPDFPNNIVWLKSINVLFSLITLGLWGYYFRTIRQFSLGLSLGLIALVGTNWRFIEVSIELMSEPLFILLSTLTLILCHRFSQPQKPLPFKHLAILMLLSVAAFYTRTMALPLIAALCLWLFMRQSRKQAFQYGIGCFLLMLPWFAWSAAKPDTTYVIGDFLVRSFQETYFQSFRMDLKYEYSLIELVSKGISELLGNLSVQFFPLLERFFLNKPTIFSESVILGLSFGLVILLGRYTYQQLKARQISPEALYVGLYLAVLPFWSFYRFYPRFIMPLLPILWAGLLFYGPITLAKNNRRSRLIPATLLAILLCLNTIHLWPYLQKSNPNDLIVNSPIPLWNEHQAAFNFLRKRTSRHAQLYISNTDETAFYALNTNRKALDIFLFLPPQKIDQRCDVTSKECLIGLYHQNATAMLTVLRQNGITHLVSSTTPVFKNQYNNGFKARKAMSIVSIILQQTPQAMREVFHTPDNVIRIYELSTP